MRCYRDLKATPTYPTQKVLWSALLWLAYLESIVAYKFFGRVSRRSAAGIILLFLFLLLTFWVTNLFSALHHP